MKTTNSTLEIAHFSYPKDFNKYSKELITCFAKRLKSLREDSAKYHNSESYDSNLCAEWNPGNIKTQEDLGKALGVSAMTVSKYERACINAIPMNRLKQLCEIFDVTVHYILGYTEEKKKTLSFDINGNAEYDEYGNIIELSNPMSFLPKDARESRDAFEELYYTNPHLFRLLEDVIYSNDYKQKVYISVLDSLRGVL